MEQVISHSLCLCQSCSKEGANSVRAVCTISEGQIAFNPGPFGQKSLTSVSAPMHNGSAPLMASLNQQMFNDVPQSWNSKYTVTQCEHSSRCGTNLKTTLLCIVYLPCTASKPNQRQTITVHFTGCGSRYK
jgi:hypothetical protein